MNNIQRVFVAVIILMSVQNSEMYGMFGWGGPILAQEIRDQNSRSKKNMNRNNSYSSKTKIFQNDEKQEKMNTPSWVQWSHQAMVLVPETNSIEQKKDNK